jgi:predicted nucleotidyltransferase
MLLNNKNVKIMAPFLSDYNASLTASTIANKYNLNQKSVSNLLNSLEKDSFLKSRIDGRNKLFYLNLDNPIIDHLISLIEHFRTGEFYKENPLIREISLKLLDISDGIVIIFGSYAKQRHKSYSDLDILIIGKYNESKFDKISEIYKIDINVKNYPLNILKKVIKNQDPLIEEVIKNHIILKGVQEFVENLKVKYHGKN